MRPEQPKRPALEGGQWLWPWCWEEATSHLCPFKPYHAAWAPWEGWGRCKEATAPHRAS